MLHFYINMILQHDNGQPAFVKVANSVNLVTFIILYSFLTEREICFGNWVKERGRVKSNSAIKTRDPASCII